jgi:RNA-directed DNA polymerase
MRHYAATVATITDRVAQASLTLVLEPVLEADFLPCSYGFRPRRRAQDAIAEARYLAARSYEWIVEGDITACFDEISHPALMDRLRKRIADKRVLALVKAFLKAGILGQDGTLRDSNTGVPQGSLCAAAHKPPYAQCRIMRSAGLAGLVGAGSASERCA